MEAKSGVFSPQYIMQGGEVETGDSSRVADIVPELSTTSMVSETASFVDANQGEIVTFAPAKPVSYDADLQTGSDLGDFLKRPVLIQSFTWDESGFGEVSFDPWSLYLGSTLIKNKLNNFAWFRGNLKVKFVINASPFYYGALLMAYTPVTNYVRAPSSTTTKYIPWSQRPHIWIYPQNNAGGEMTLPFFWHNNYADLTSATEISNLGQLHALQYTPLQSANGTSTNGCTIQIYAWMEDPVLMGPTVKLAMQGKDEYSSTPIAAAMSAVEKWSAYIGKIPYIGKFALATSIGAGAASRIAALFGWSNVPVISNVKPVKNLPFHDMASAHISEPTSKFTLDPKGELSVDPAILGLSSEDELAMSSIVQRESYLTSFDWVTTDTATSLKFACYVTPSLFDRGTVSAAGTYTIGMTPMAHIGQMFQHWHGDIIFRFRIICSQYHKGRLRLTWDPTSTLLAAADSTHVCYTKIVDIGVDNDVEFRIPYMQARPWLRTDTGVWTANNFSNTSTSAPNQELNNGSITVRVLTNLSAPIDISTVSVLVFARGAENLEFANPREISRRVSLYSMQSLDEPMTPTTPSDNRYLVNWGEAIPSLRILLRRTTKYDTLAFGRAIAATGAATESEGSVWAFQSRIPGGSGYDPSALSTARGVETPGTTYPFSYVQNTPISWVSAAFVASRGAMRWHYNLEGTGGPVPTSIRVVRTVYDINTSDLRPTYSTVADGYAATASVVANARWNRYSSDAGCSGQVVTNSLTQSGVSVEAPMMSNTKFVYTKPEYALLGTTVDGSNYDNLCVQAIVHPSDNFARGLLLERYVSIGTDFNLFFYLNAPHVQYNATQGSTPV